jgi:hypothetical protein
MLIIDICETMNLASNTREDHGALLFYGTEWLIWDHQTETTLFIDMLGVEVARFQQETL